LASVTSTFSDPLTLINNIVSHNRSFHWTKDLDGNGPGVISGLLPNFGAGQAAVYDDFGVLPDGSGSLSPTFSIVTSIANDPGSNNALTPAATLFVRENFNGNRNGVGNTIGTAAVFDEAGNATVSVDFGPLTLLSPVSAANTTNLRDYHLPATGANNIAVNTGTALSNVPDVGIPGVTDVLTTDYDAQARPNGAAPDKGADERNTTTGTVRIFP
jgi:hypothetical protein